MALRRIIWNSLYAKQPHKRRFLGMRIRLHYVRMGLARRGVEKASVRYIFAFPLRPSGQRGSTESLALRRPVAMSSLIFVYRTIDMSRLTIFTRQTMRIAVASFFLVYILIPVLTSITKVLDDRQ